MICAFLTSGSGSGRTRHRRQIPTADAVADRHGSATAEPPCAGWRVLPPFVGLATWDTRPHSSAVLCRGGWQQCQCISIRGSVGAYCFDPTRRLVHGRARVSRGAPREGTKETRFFFFEKTQRGLDGRGHPSVQAKPMPA